MTKRSKILLAAAGGAVIVCFVAIQIYLNSMRKVNLTDEQAHRITDRDLPLGTSRSVVKQFLDARGWNYSDRGEYILAVVRDAEHDYVIRTDITIQFQFDSGDKLKSYSVGKFLTGP
jgi:hypothetical protein